MPIARTRTEVEQGAGLAVDFQIEPCLPRTLLLCHGLGGSSPRCAPRAAGEAPHARPAPLWLQLRQGREAGALSWLCLPHAWPWLCTTSVQGQAACGHHRHCPARGHLFHVILCAECWASAGEEHHHLLAFCPQQMSVPGTIHLSGRCLGP